MAAKASHCKNHISNRMRRIIIHTGFLLESVDKWCSCNQRQDLLIDSVYREILLKNDVVVYKGKCGKL